MTAPVRPELCNRLRGRSVRDCVCRLPRELGWLDCPPDAQGLLEPVDPAPPDFPTHASVVDGVLVHGHAPLTSTGREAVSKVIAAARVRLSGDICGDCGSPNLRWTGTCKTCGDWGSSAGGCS